MKNLIFMVLLHYSRLIVTYRKTLYLNYLKETNIFYDEQKR